MRMVCIKQRLLNPSGKNVKVFNIRRTEVISVKNGYFLRISLMSFNVILNFALIFRCIVLFNHCDLLLIESALPDGN